MDTSLQHIDVGRVVQELRQGSDKNKGSAAFLLAHFAGGSLEARQAALAAGALPALVGCLRSTTVRTLQGALVALGQLLESSPGSQAAAVASGILAPLLHLLSSSKPDSGRNAGKQAVLAPVVRIILQLTIHEAHAVLRAGATWALARYLGSPDPELTELVLLSLCQLAFTSAAGGAGRALVCGYTRSAIPPLVQLLSHPSGAAQEAAAALLGCLAHASPDNKQAVAAAGGLHALLQLLTAHVNPARFASSSLQQTVCQALRQLTYGNPANCAAIATHAPVAELWHLSRRLEPMEALTVLQRANAQAGPAAFAVLHNVAHFYPESHSHIAAAALFAANFPIGSDRATGLLERMLGNGPLLANPHMRPPAQPLTALPISHWHAMRVQAAQQAAARMVGAAQQQASRAHGTPHQRQHAGRESAQRSRQQRKQQQRQQEAAKRERQARAAAEAAAAKAKAAAEAKAAAAAAEAKAAAAAAEAKAAAAEAEAEREHAAVAVKLEAAVAAAWDAAVAASSTAVHEEHAAAPGEQAKAAPSPTSPSPAQPQPEAVATPQAAAAARSGAGKKKSRKKGKQAVTAVAAAASAEQQAAFEGVMPAQQRRQAAAYSHQEAEAAAPAASAAASSAAQELPGMGAPAASSAAHPDHTPEDLESELNMLMQHMGLGGMDPGQGSSSNGNGGGSSSSSSGGSSAGSALFEGSSRVAGAVAMWAAGSAPPAEGPDTPAASAAEMPPVSGPAAARSGAAAVGASSTPPAASIGASSAGVAGSRGPPTGLDPALLESLLCPITAEPMQDPVVAADGMTYERAAIEGWIARQQAAGQVPSSPLTGAPLGSTVLHPSHLVRSMVASLQAAGLLH